MRKVLLFLLLPLVLMGCDFAPTRKGEPSFDNIDFTQYDSFVLSSGNLSSRSSISGAQLYGVTSENEYDRIQVTSSRGEVWEVQEIEKVGTKLMAMGLNSADSYSERKVALVNIETNESYDLSSTAGNAYLDLTDIGAYDNGMAIRINGGIYRLNLENESLDPVTNPSTDYCYYYYVTKSGHIVVETTTPATKLYPADGSMPITLSDSHDGFGVADSDGRYISSSDVDYIVDLSTKKKIFFSNEGVSMQELPDTYATWSLKPWGFTSLITGSKAKGSSISWNGRLPSRVVHYNSITNEIVISEIVSGEFLANKYPLGFSIADDYRAIIGDTLIFEQDSKLKTYNLNTQVMTTIVDTNLSSWQIQGESIVYTVYTSATTTASYSYSLETQISTEIESGAVPQILKLVSF